MCVFIAVNALVSMEATAPNLSSLHDRLNQLDEALSRNFSDEGRQS